MVQCFRVAVVLETSANIAIVICQEITKHAYEVSE